MTARYSCAFYVNEKIRDRERGARLTTATLDKARVSLTLFEIIITGEITGKTTKECAEFCWQISVAALIRRGASRSL